MVRASNDLLSSAFRFAKMLPLPLPQARIRLSFFDLYLPSTSKARCIAPDTRGPGLPPSSISAGARNKSEASGHLQRERSNVLSLHGISVII